MVSRSGRGTGSRPKEAESFLSCTRAHSNRSPPSLTIVTARLLSSMHVGTIPVVCIENLPFLRAFLETGKTLNLAWLLSR